MKLTPIQQPLHNNGDAPSAPVPNPELRNCATGQFLSVIKTGMQDNVGVMSNVPATQRVSIGGDMNSSQAVGPAERVSPTRMTPLGMGGMSPKKDVDADYDNSVGNDTEEKEY